MDLKKITQALALYRSLSDEERTVLHVAYAVQEAAPALAKKNPESAPEAKKKKPAGSARSPRRSPLSYWTCSVCGKKFATQKGRKIHTRLSHNHRQPKPEVKPPDPAKGGS